MKDLSRAGPMPADRRQSEAAADLQRGVARLLMLHGYASLAEVALVNGRRADVMGLGPAGEVWIVEIKSSLEDFHADRKWGDYRDYCDRLFFAVAPEFPREVLPAETGLIIADRYGGEITREAPLHRLAGARRKALTLRFARIGAARVQASLDPGVAAEFIEGRGE